MAHPERVCIVLPSLKISGGNRELLRLADDLTASGREVTVVCMWRSPHESSAGHHVVRYLSDWKTDPRRAVLQLPRLWWRFLCLATRHPDASAARTAAWIFSHYATLPLSLCVPRNRRWYFVQDIEWRFLANPLLAAVLKRVILYFYARGRTLSANAYLSSELRTLGLNVALEAPIWADSRFGGPLTGHRDIDVVMVLRKGHHKRTDLYVEFIRLAQAAGLQWRLAVITPEDAIHAQVSSLVTTCLVRPTAQAMRELYARARVFLHLSEHEGFGLPPLEAMGSGCVPVCRDSGGVRAYMTDDLEKLVHSRDLPMTRVIDVVDSLLRDGARWGYLSSLARRVFDEGVNRAQARRRTISNWRLEPDGP